MDSQTDEGQRPPFNGGELLAAVPDVRSGGGGFYVTVRLTREQSPEPFVSAWVPWLGSPTWASGTYSHKLDTALAVTYQRAGLPVPDNARIDGLACSAWLDRQEPYRNDWLAARSMS